MHETPIRPRAGTGIKLDTSIHPPALNRKREGLRPRCNLGLKLVNPCGFAAGDLELEVLELVGLLGKGSLDLFADLDALVNVARNLFEVSDTKAAARHGRGANTDTARGESALVTRDAVLVAGNIDLFENGLDTGTVKIELAEVKQNHVGVGTVRDKLVAKVLELVLERLGVGNNLLLVSLELGGSGLLQSNSQGSDGMIVRTTLVTREDGEVDGVLQIVQGLLAILRIRGADALAEEDHSTARTAERLVRRGSNDIGVEEG